MKNRRVVDRIWSAVARAAIFLALSLERVSRGAARAAAALQVVGSRAWSRATGLPIGADVAADWVAPEPLPVAAAPAPVQPPPVPRDARPSVDEERQWEELIAQAKTDGSAARAPAGDDDWSKVIASAKRQAAPRAGGVGDEWGAAIAAAKKPERRRAPVPPPARSLPPRAPAGRS